MSRPLEFERDDEDEDDDGRRLLVGKAKKLDGCDGRRGVAPTSSVPPSAAEAEDEGRRRGERALFGVALLPLLGSTKKLLG